MLKIQSWECICCSPGMCVFTPWWSLTLESCNDKSKLRGHLPYSGPSSEVSTPSSLYMEYGKWVLGRLGLQLCLCSPLVPAKLWAAWLSSQLCGGYIPYSLTLPSFSTPVLEIILPCHFSSPLWLRGPTLSYAVGVITMNVEPGGMALWVGERDLGKRPLSVWA